MSSSLKNENTQQPDENLEDRAARKAGISSSPTTLNIELVKLSWISKPCKLSELRKLSKRSKIRKLSKLSKLSQLSNQSKQSKLN